MTKKIKRARIGSIVKLIIDYQILDNVNAKNRYGIVTNIYDYEHESYEQLLNIEEDYEVEIQGYPHYRRWFAPTEFEIIHW